MCSAMGGAMLKVGRLILVALGVTLLLASCVVLRDVVAQGGLGAPAGETMLGATVTAVSLPLSALFFPLGAVLSFMAFAMTRATALKVRQG
jgi:hypothetical protein